ncbi:MAG: cytochrome c3 family protein, partial [Pseudomonadota bacterium]
MTSTPQVTRQLTASPRLWWVVWIVATISIALFLGSRMVSSEQQQLFMPGPLSDGHHQLELSCGSCHLNPLGGGEVLQQSCIDCHGEDRKKPHDSHPISKFEDPRNAARLQEINAIECTTCHMEHRPEITAKNGVTIPADFCVHCHLDIGEERASHADMEFATCASAGC